MPSPGLYIVNSTGETVPVMTGDGEGDFELLEDFLHERGFEIETRDLEEFVVEEEYLTDCDECGMPVSHDGANEFSFGTLCDRCAAGRGESPL